MGDKLTAGELSNLRLGTLKAAVDDWKTMLHRLQLLADGGEGGVNATDLAARAEAADWKGVNATVSRAFVTRTADQFGDAAAQAKSVLGILRDVHARLGKHQTELRDLTEELLQRKMMVEPSGTVSYVGPSSPVVDTGEPPQVPNSEDIALAQQRVDHILHSAAEVDRIAARALRALTAAPYDFTDGGAKNLAEADRQQGAADAAKWVKEIKAGGVESWSEEKIARFNAMLEYQRDNPGFTEHFATGLGAEGTLQFWRELAAPSTGSRDGESAKLLAQVQENLSLSLASATHVDSPAMDAWKKDLIAAGGKSFPLGGTGPVPLETALTATNPTGFQIMSSLMHEGRFESKFLRDYGTALITSEREGGLDPDQRWIDTASLDYPEPKAPRPNDPLVGYLEALGHNPEASLGFFQGSTGKGDDKLDNFEYLMGDGTDSREWIKTFDRKHIGYDSLGHALESATLGYGYDESEPRIPPLDTAAQREAREGRLNLLQQVMATYPSADAVEKHDGIADSLGRIAAGHIDSLNYSMANFGGAGDFADRDGFFRAEQNGLRDLGEGYATNFLRAVAADEDAHGSLAATQQIYGVSLMASQGDNHTAVVNAGMHSVMMHGMFDGARAEAIAGDFADEEEKRAMALEKQANWREFGVGALVGATVGVGSAVMVPAAGAAAIAVPIAYETAGGAAETMMSNHTVDWLKENEFKNDVEAIASVQDALLAGQNSAMIPLKNYMEEQRVPEDDVATLLREARGVYNDGVQATDMTIVKVG
ncbi:hypothetical protein [Streptomyces chilikensis]|uniref:hypothetical protein n=1 Tax=Streptomyces chilikensis TaxID=1194079 RepID=UPI000A3DE773|nr:hypothetical protein [Streptomyces chilikensis]